jgi:hypothetical protein
LIPKSQDVLCANHDTGIVKFHTCSRSTGKILHPFVTVKRIAKRLHDSLRVDHRENEFSRKCGIQKNNVHRGTVWSKARHGVRRSPWRASKLATVDDGHRRALCSKFQIGRRRQTLRHDIGANHLTVVSELADQHIANS